MYHRANSLSLILIHSADDVHLSDGVCRLSARVQLKTLSSLLNKEMYDYPDAVLGQCSIRIATHFFVNFDIFKWVYLAYYWVYLHQTWGFCKAWPTLNDYDVTYI